MRGTELSDHTPVLYESQLSNTASTVCNLETYLILIKNIMSLIGPCMNTINHIYDIPPSGTLLRSEISHISQPNCYDLYINTITIGDRGLIHLSIACSQEQIDNLLNEDVDNLQTVQKMLF